MKISIPGKFAMSMMMAILVVSSICVTNVFASKPDWKLVATTVIRFTFEIPSMPGIIPPELVGEEVALFIVAHINTVGKIVEEPTLFLYWGLMDIWMPANGKIWTIFHAMAQVTISMTDMIELSLSIHGAQFEYVGTLAFVPTEIVIPPGTLPPEIEAFLPPAFVIPEKGQMNAHVVIMIEGVPATFTAHIIIKFEDFTPRVLLAKAG